MKLKTSLAVLYECLEQDIRPIADAIVKEYDDVMNYIPDPKYDSDPKDLPLSDLLDLASNIAYEVEYAKRRDKENKDSASGA